MRGTKATALRRVSETLTIGEPLGHLSPVAQGHVQVDPYNPGTLAYKYPSTKHCYHTLKRAYKQRHMFPNRPPHYLQPYLQREMPSMTNFELKPNRIARAIADTLRR